MRLSIIVPIYNGERFINRCINSLIKQSFKDFEIVIVNDGSNDHSEEKIVSILFSALTHIIHNPTFAP